MKIRVPFLQVPKNCLVGLCTDESLAFCPVVNAQAGSDSAPTSGQIQHCGNMERSEFPASWDPGQCRPSWTCSHWTLLLETARAVQRLYGGFVLYNSLLQNSTIKRLIWINPSLQTHRVVVKSAEPLFPVLDYGLWWTVEICSVLRGPRWNRPFILWAWAHHQRRP